MKKDLILNKIELVGFLGYFIILLIERILALIFSFNIGDNYAVFSGNFFPILSYSLTALSVIGGFILLPKLVIAMFSKLFSNELYDFESNYTDIVIVSMVILVGGMMHTGLTISGIQFAAYGLLILAMLMRTLKAIDNKENKYDAIMSLVYLTFYAMAVPVCYMTNLTGFLGVAFYVVEFITTLTLILTYGCMLNSFFKNGKSSFALSHFLVMLVLCSATLALKWVDEINVFVLMFVVATTITYIINLIYKLIKKA